MQYKIKYSDTIKKDLKKLDGYTRKNIQSWISKHLENCEDPKKIGKPLTGNSKGQWRYRIGDYRLICIIEEDVLLITAIRVGHRKYIYE